MPQLLRTDPTQPGTQSPSGTSPTGRESSALHCLICRQAFEFANGDSAIVLRHVAYGYDFVHAGACLDAALSWIFAEPQYDCAAFAQDRVRKRILDVESANGDVISQIASTPRANWFLPQWCWALVERHDGTRRYEAIVRDHEWLDEPGGAEFPKGHVLAAARSLVAGCGTHPLETVTERSTPS